MTDGVLHDRDRARLTASWGKLRWEQTRRGALLTHVDGWCVCIAAAPTGSGYLISISRNIVGRVVKMNEVYPTVDEARSGCLEAVLWAMKNMALRPADRIDHVGTPADVPGWSEMRRRRDSALVGRRDLQDPVDG